MRWIGHRLHADVEIAADDSLTLAAARKLTHTLRRELLEHLPALRTASISFEPAALDLAELSGGAGSGHHHAPAPFQFTGELADGLLEIVDTPRGERLRLTLKRDAGGLKASVTIDRPAASPESLQLNAVPDENARFESSVAPAEPHEFSATLHLVSGKREETLRFSMEEPTEHRH